MDIQTYRVLHILGLVLLMLGLGAVLGAGRDAARPRRLGLALHGLGLLVMLVAGFGLMARRGWSGPGEWPLEIILKMVIWGAIAVLPILVRKGVVPTIMGWLLAAALATTAAWLALTMPLST